MCMYTYMYEKKGICAMCTGAHCLWVSRRGQESGVSVLAEEGAEVPVGHEGHDNGGPRQPLNDHAQRMDDVAMVELLHNHNLLHHLLHISHSEEPCGRVHTLDGSLANTGLQGLQPNLM